jgi:hypothetical protein
VRSSRQKIARFRWIFCQAADTLYADLWRKQTPGMLTVPVSPHGAPPGAPAVTPSPLIHHGRLQGVVGELSGPGAPRSVHATVTYRAMDVTTAQHTDMAASACCCRLAQR